MVGNIYGDGQRGGIFGARIDPALLRELDRRAAEKRNEIERSTLGGRAKQWWDKSTFFKPAYEELVGGLTAPGDVLSGAQPTMVADPQTGEFHTAPELMDRAGALAGTLTLGAGAIPAEANALRMGMKGIPDYRGTHTAPSSRYGSQLHDLTPSFSDSIYSPQAAQFHGHGGGGDPIDEETARLIRKFRGKPDAEVTVYRAVPKDAPDTINPGDWVTINRNYARVHGEGPLSGEYKVIQHKARVRDLWGDGSSMHEFGYAPE